MNEMQAITLFSKSTDWIQRAGMLLTLLALCLLSGCAHQTTISEGSTYLQVQAQQAELDSYKMRLKDSQQRLTAVIPEMSDPSPQIPPPLSGSLAQFLLDNDCTQVSVKDPGALHNCIQSNQVKLIQTTRLLEAERMTTYAAKMTINQLIGNINTVASGMDGPDTPKTILGLQITPSAKEPPSGTP
jgi:hypothetical protein